MSDRPLHLAAWVCPNLYRENQKKCQTDRYASRGKMSDRPLRLAAWVCPNLYRENHKKCQTDRCASRGKMSGRPLRLAAWVCPNLYRKKGGKCQTDRYASQRGLPKSLREDGGKMSDRPLHLPGVRLPKSLKGKSQKMSGRPLRTPRASAQISIGKITKNVRPTVTPCSVHAARMACKRPAGHSRQSWT